MDISNIKKYINSLSDIDQISKGIIEAKNEAKNIEKGQEQRRSEFFKTLRDPLVEQQKNIDEKQDQMILRQNTSIKKQGDLIKQLKSNLRFEINYYIRLIIENGHFKHKKIYQFIV